MRKELKERVRNNYKQQLRFRGEWRSAESCLLESLKDNRRFFAELIAESVVECIDDGDLHPTIEVHEITSETWVDNYRWLDRMIKWMCEY